MDPNDFDRLTQTLLTVGSRRTLFASLLAVAGSALGLARGRRAAAQGCTLKANGEPCQSGEECCSGRCERRKNGGRVCKQAENQGICTIEENVCISELPDLPSCGTAGGDTCFCVITREGHSLCSDIESDAVTCDCTSNRQCKRRLGKGARCILTAGPTCEGCATDTACVRPCPNPDSV